jgi:hypothetical protein
VRVIDDWTTARPLALIVEVKLGAGALIICGADLSDIADPVSRQLFLSLTSYMNGPNFAPAVEATESQVRALIA